jgi:acetylornithine deacetylase/succinyl-diaminopimelate desuccinylase-like protein
MTTVDLSSEAILKETIEIASIAAPPFGEQTRGDEVERRMRATGGWQVERDAIGNVICRLGDPASIDGGVWAIAHLDTVFAIEQELKFERNGGAVAGCGIGDNSLGVATLLNLARDFSGSTLNKPLIFVFDVGEEGLGDLRGVRHLIREGLPAKASSVLAVEGHRQDAICTTAVGSLRYRGRIEGPGGHSWGDRGRPSAVHSLVQYAEQVLGAQKEIGGDLSVNIGTVHGGTYVTAIAASAEVTFEARSTSEAMLKTFEDWIHRAAKETPLEVMVEEVGRRPAGVMPNDHPLVLAAQAARAAEGLAAARYSASSTDANAFIAAGIPAICTGLTMGRNQHHPSEEIDVEPIGKGVAVLRRLLKELTA